MGKRSISGLKIEDLILGTGAEALKGKNVAVHAVGRLNKGEVFLSTYDYGRPWRFKAGGHKAIPGVAKAVVGMRVGGKRRIRVSPHLGYRDQGMPPNELFQVPVPPNSVRTAPQVFQGWVPWIQVLIIVNVVIAIRS